MLHRDVLHRGSLEACVGLAHLEFIAGQHRIQAMTELDYTFHEHFGYGLLREDRMHFDRWGRVGQRWLPIQFNPFTASMSRIAHERAVELVSGGDLYAPNVESAAA
jgi:hypothetical protein